MAKDKSNKKSRSLLEEPFSFLANSGVGNRERVQLFFHNKLVTTLSGRTAMRFLDKAEAGDSQQRQLLMAKATGHFKHGNERMGKANKRGSGA